MSFGGKTSSSMPTSTPLRESQQSGAGAIVSGETDGSVQAGAALEAKPHAFGGAVLSPKHARELTPSLVLAIASALSEQSTLAPLVASSSPLSPAVTGSAGAGSVLSSPHGGGVVSRSTPSNADGPFRIVSSSASMDGGFDSGVSPGGNVQYTVWITEAWRVLGWAEPSAALFWEMATMYHTLHVAGRAYAEEVYGRLNLAAAAAAGSSSSAIRDAPSASATPSGIPPILSCGSTSSMGSGSAANDSALNAAYRSATQASHSPGNGNFTSRPLSPISDANPAGTSTSELQQYPSPVKSSAPVTKPSMATATGSAKSAPASAKELPVWLVAMFLLMHCEEQAFLRNVSGEDERRFGRTTPDAVAAVTAGLSARHSRTSISANTVNDFSSFLLHPTLSPRTRIHASLHSDNTHCTSYLLRHLRKFLLLCAIPHNTDAVWAITTLAESKTHDPEYAEHHRDLNSRPGDSLFFLSHHRPKPDVDDLRIRHEEDHENIGADIRLTADDLDRLNFVLQSPMGGLIDDPPIRLGEFIISLVLPAIGSGISVADAEMEVRKHLEAELLHAGELDGEDVDTMQEEDGASEVMANLSLQDTRGDHLGTSGTTATATTGIENAKEKAMPVAARRKELQALGYHKELSYADLRGTTILLKPNSHPDNLNVPSSGASHASGGGSSDYGALASGLNGRLQDLNVSDCSDAHMYLLQPFEHATIAACTGCTIVVGAVAGLLHVVDCERVTITSAARRVLVSNCLDVLHCVFTPSPPLLVGDNRSCQFAPYNTYYDGLREDLLATGLAAALATAPGDSCHQQQEQGGNVLALQCASNKWKQPVELAKLEIPQLPSGASGVGAGAGTGPGSPTSPTGADEKRTEDAMKTPILLPASEFQVLLVPIESESAKLRRQQQEESTTTTAAASLSISSASPPLDEIQLQLRAAAAAESSSSPAVVNSVSGINPSEGNNDGTLESQYCRNLADVLQLSPFRLPMEYERRALLKADRMRTLQQKMQSDLTPEQQVTLEEELNRGFRDWLVTSGNLRQVLDLVHMDKLDLERTKRVVA